MQKAQKRKTLIEPKVRLLLWIYLHGVKDESNWLAKLSDVIDYGEGNIDTALADLAHMNLIESSQLDSRGPPYKITDEGKRFLQPILVTSRIGIWTGLWVSVWTMIYFLVFLNQPLLMMVYWLPLLFVSFIMLTLVLIFYPFLLVRFGKISYRRKFSSKKRPV